MGKKKSTNRIQPILSRLKGVEDSEVIMKELQVALSDSQSQMPIPGKVYVYTYIANSAELLTDMYPVVAVEGVYEWGWTGINLHLKKQRNYNIGSNATPLYMVKANEVQTLLTLPLMQLYQS